MASPQRSNYGVETLTASTSLELHKHVGKAINLSAAAGMTATLPLATGSGEELDIHVVTTVTSNDYIITGAGSDVLNGAVTVATDIAGVTCPAAVTDTTLTMNGSTTGGLAGSHVTCRDVASGVWHVSGVLVSTGVEADPWS